MRFSDVTGQEDVKNRLVKMVQENRISHALLFLGAEGWGNLPLALAFAQYIVCEKVQGSSFDFAQDDMVRQAQGDMVRQAHHDIENPPDIENVTLSAVEGSAFPTDSCGKCNACLKMSKLVHPDISFSFPIQASDDANKPKRCVDFVNQWRESVLENPYLNEDDWYRELGLENKQGIIPAAESGDIIRRLSLKAVEAPYKIVIIWVPENLNASAANKLLKIIEEPPDRTLFFLIAQNYEEIIPTILSRTQLVKLNRLSDEQISEVLQKKHAMTTESAKRIAHHSAGNLHEAVNMVYNYEEEFNQNQQFIEWMRGCWQLNLPKINEIMDSLSDKGRERQKFFLRNCMNLLRESLILNYAHPSMVRFEGEELKTFTAFAKLINPSNSEVIADAFNSAHYHIERNGNFKIIFTDLSFGLNRMLKARSE